MYKKILVPMALNHGIGDASLKIARKLVTDDGHIFAVHVFEMPSGSALAFPDDEALKTASTTTGEHLKERVVGQSDVTPVLLHGHTARSIIEYATDHEIDCIAIGSHEPGLIDYMLGSTAARVVRHAPCAVHVLRSAV